MLGFLTNHVQFIGKEVMFLVGQANDEINHLLGWEPGDQLAFIFLRLRSSSNDSATHAPLQVAHELVLLCFDHCQHIHGSISHIMCQLEIFPWLSKATGDAKNAGDVKDILSHLHL